MNETKKHETGKVDATPDQPSVRKLRALDADVSGRRLKVVFTEYSGRAGERCLLDRGLARLYERQGKVRIVNDNKQEQRKEE